MTRRRMLMGLVVLVLLATAGTWLYLRWRARGADTIVTLYGNVDIREAEPAFDDTGAVTQMLVDEGARLHQGELIARIDDRRYAARLAQAQQQARNLAAVLARLMHGSRPQEIAQARANMQGLQALYANDRILFDRTAGLVPQGVASTEDLDNARARLRASRENFEAARQAYVLAVKGPRVEDIIAARHAYEAALATVRLAQREFDDTRLYAPADRCGCVRTSPRRISGNCGSARPRPSRPTASPASDIGAGSATSRPPPNSRRNRSRPRSCAPGWSIKFGSSSAMPTANCASACRQPSP